MLLTFPLQSDRTQTQLLSITDDCYRISPRWAGGQPLLTPNQHCYSTQVKLSLKDRQVFEGSLADAAVWCGVTESSRSSGQPLLTPNQHCCSTQV